MIINETDGRKDQVVAVAKAMMAAARTAPKGKGTDRLEIITLYGDDMHRLAEEMRRYSEKSGFKFFLRDADNVEQSEAVVLLGTTYGIFNLNCGFCGFPTCVEKEKFPAVPCAFNSGDLGIANRICCLGCGRHEDRQPCNVFCGTCGTRPWITWRV